MLRRDALAAVEQIEAEQSQKSESKLDAAKAEAARLLQESRG